MSAKKRRFKTKLSVSGIDRLKKELLTYKTELSSKTEQFVRELANLGIPIIDGNITGAKGDSDKTHATYITVNSFGEYSRAVLHAEGKDLLFIEFGAGIHYNGAAGTSPNPKGAELGYTIGSYGQGKGKNDSWTYSADSGEWVRSYGTQATMPMYKASQEIIANIQKIARNVFRS